MKSIRTIEKITAWALVLTTVLFNFPSISAWAREESITNVAQLTAFLNGCQSDEYSKGKSFAILNDIDCGGALLPQGSVFCGSLAANGCKIYNFKMKVTSNAGGFFCEIGEEGYVSGLNLDGEISGVYEKASSEMSKDKIIDDIRKNLGATGVSLSKSTRPLGGIAGINNGRIYECGFEGSIDGEKNVGGICGKNADSGIIEGCTMKAAASGIENTGGIVGENRGIVRSCVNTGKINSKADAAAVNTGGIVGENIGVVDGCTNTAKVGCKGYGTNTGGIAGKQSGCVLSSVNSGAVYGKKNVGGIVGLFSPYTDIDADLDSVRDEIKKEKETINDEYENLKSDIRNDIDEIKDDLNIFSSSNRSTVNEGRRKVLDSVSDYIDNAAKNSDSAQENKNELSDSLSDFLNRAKDMGESLETVSNAMEESLSSMNDVLERARDSSDLTDESIRSLLSQIDQSLNTSSKDNTRLKESLADAADRIDINTRALDSVADSMDKTLSAASDALNSLEKNGDDISDSITAPLNLLYKQLKSKQKKIEQFKKRLESIKEKLEDLVESLDKTDIGGWGIGGGNSEEIPGEIIEDDIVVKKQSKISSVLSDIASIIVPSASAAEYKALNEIIDTEAIKEEMRKIISVDVALDRNVAGEYFDNAVVKLCVNTGKVYSYSQSGGIIGCMGVEKLYTDGETVTLPSGRSIVSDITMKAVVDSCVNDAKITAKNTDSGAVVGYANMGIVKNSLGAGEISSKENVGGIGGNCVATVLFCVGAARIKADEYAGGIAGRGGNIHECYSIALLENENPVRSGSIAGSIEGSIKNNYFLDEGVGGIGGISYEDNAQGIKFNDMISQDKLPEKMNRFFNDDWFVDSGDMYFPQIKALSEAEGASGEIIRAKSAHWAKTHFDVEFTAGGECIKSLVKEYGEILSEDEIPPIPAKSGKVASYNRSTDKKILRHTTFNAVYEDAVLTIASSENPPLILLEGTFGEKTRLSVKEIQCKEKFDGYKIGAAYSFSLTNYADSNGGFKVRVLDKKGKGVKIALIKTGEVLDAERDGSYLVFELSEAMDFAVLEKSAPVWIFVIAIAALCALLAIALLWAKRKGKIFVK